MRTDNSIHFRITKGCSWESIRVFETDNVSLHEGRLQSITFGSKICWTLSLSFGNYFCKVICHLYNIYNNSENHIYIYPNIYYNSCHDHKMILCGAKICYNCKGLIPYRNILLANRQFGQHTDNPLALRALKNQSVRIIAPWRPVCGARTHTRDRIAGKKENECQVNWPLKHSKQVVHKLVCRCVRGKMDDPFFCLLYGDVTGFSSNFANAVWSLLHGVASKSAELQATITAS